MICSVGWVLERSGGITQLCTSHPQLPIAFQFVPYSGYHHTGCFTLPEAWEVCGFFPEAETQGTAYLHTVGTTWVAFWMNSTSNLDGRHSAHLENICLGLLIWHCHSWSHCKTGPCGEGLIFLDTLCFALMVKQLVRSKQTGSESC